MKKTRSVFNCILIIALSAVIFIPSGCKKESSIKSDASSINSSNEKSSHTQKFSADVANEWMNLQMLIMKTTTGEAHVAFTRQYAYTSIALYESVVPGMPSYRSLVGQLTELPAMPAVSNTLNYHWACSANAAMAAIIKDMFPTATPANLASIDSLENVFNTQFSSETDAATITRSSDFGKAVAQTVFTWSQSDNYNHAFDAYTPPPGDGLWVPTPTAFAAASAPYWRNMRVMVAGSGDNAQPPAPTPYSTVVGSDFYNMVKHVYDVSQTLTTDQTNQALYWRDLPGVTSSGHYISILRQVLEQSNSDLEVAASAYALSSITVYDAAISCWTTKFTDNLVRPITYIRDVMGYTTWNSLLVTPAHPEYSSAHAVLSAADADALESIFGANYAFTDHTYDYLGYPARSFSSFDAFGEDAGNSRLFAGIHYQPSIDAGFIQGRIIAQNILNTLVLKK